MRSGSEHWAHMVAVQEEMIEEVEEAEEEASRSRR